MDPADHRKLVDDFERQAKVAGLLAILRQVGIMRYGPATPTPRSSGVSATKPHSTASTRRPPKRQAARLPSHATFTAD
jgi:hypothetical protein